MNKISITRKISRELVHIKRSTFEGSKVNVPQVAFFDKNMAIGKSKNLVMLHPYDLTQPSFRDYADFGTYCWNTNKLKVIKCVIDAKVTYQSVARIWDH